MLLVADRLPLTDRDADISILDHVANYGDVGRTVGYYQGGPLEAAA